MKFYELMKKKSEIAFKSLKLFNQSNQIKLNNLSIQTNNFIFIIK